MSEPMLPVPYRLAGRTQETADSVTLTLDPISAALAPFGPGQFTMMFAPGVGEVAISVSGDPTADGAQLVQTVREVGAVSRALCRGRIGGLVGLRGPFGVGWDVESAVGQDVVVVAGGVGLAPLRPVILSVLARRSRFRRLVVIAGARQPADFLYRAQVRHWQTRADLELELTVDRPATGWTGPVGFVTDSLARVDLAPERTTAFVCGPEPMMRFTAEMLRRRGLADRRIQVSLERNMKCGVALCGHCQLGPVLVCRDGPVVTYDVAAPLFAVREL